MPDTNKITYGIKNVVIFPATIAADGTATYGTAIPVKGAVNLNMDQQGEVTKFYADNIVYYTGVANNGYEGTLEVALLPDAVRTSILGEIKDANTTDGVMIEEVNAATVHFALAFQFEGDIHAKRHVLYNCTMTRPAIAGSTKESSIDPKTETLNISATSIYNAALDKDIVKASATPTEATQYNAWLTTVYQPT